MPPDSLAEPEIARAEQSDLAGILALMDANQPEHGGSLSARLPRARLEAMLGDLPLVVARRGGQVVGFLLAASKPTVADVPVIAAMLTAYPGSAGAYVYGPVAIDAQERRRGLAARLFGEVRRLLPGREGILFIRADNTASLHAHERMGVIRRGEFVHRGFRFFVFSFFG